MRLASTRAGIRLLGCATTFPILLAGQVVINEILFDPLPDSPDTVRQHQWVEIANKGSDPVDLQNYRLAARVGPASSRPLPAVALPAGGYLTLHIATGQDRPDTGAYYTQDPAGTLVWNPAKDEAALYVGDKIVDFVAWHSGLDPFTPGKAHEDAVAAGIWTTGQYLRRNYIARTPGELFRYVTPGEPIGRDARSTDSNQPSDFDAGGGVDALGPTPGRSNLDLMSLPPEEEAQADAKGSSRFIPARAKWTIMLYMACGTEPAVIEGYCLGYLKGIEERNGSNNNINYVAQFDRRFGPIRDAAGNQIEAGALRGYIRGKAVSKPGEAPLLPRQPKGKIDLGRINMGASGTLREFITDTVANYPADRYALIFVGHGRSWKGMLTDTSHPGLHAPFDELNMGELSEGLAGSPVLDLIVFNNCLMSGLEVAHQIAANGRYMVASEDVMDVFQGLGVRSMPEFLNANPQASGKELGEWMVSGYLPSRINAVFPSEANPTLALIDLTKIRDVVTAVDGWSKEMRPALGLFQKRLNPRDNVQWLVREARGRTITFLDRNFIDLLDLTRQIAAAGLPCGISKIPEVQKAVRAAVLSRTFLIGPNLPAKDSDAMGGLSIYFPELRAGPRPDSESSGAYFFNEYYDYPSTRESGADSYLRVYAQNHDQLPLQAQTSETPTLKLDARTEWPAPPSPGLLFTRDTAWSRMLERYYHPVAEAAIRHAEAGKDTIQPTTIPGGECENSQDVITVPLGAVIYLTGIGSSDADRIPLQQGFGLEHVAETPYAYTWDFDSRVECPTLVPGGKCIAPTEVEGSPGDVALLATDNADQDFSLTDDLHDDVDGRGAETMTTCKTAGIYMVTLTVFDDNHLWSPDHDTSPAGTFVHPQTSSHQAQILCGVKADSFVSTGPISYNQTGDTQVQEHAWTGDPVQTLSRLALSQGEFVASNPDKWLPNYPVFVTAGPGVRNLEANGVRIPDGGEGQAVTDSRGVLRTTFINGDPGTGRLRLRAADGPQYEIPFTIVPRLAPLPDEIIVTPPSGALTVDRDATIILEARRNGQPQTDVVFTLWSSTSTAMFSSGAPFRRNTATQTRTAASGRTSATFRAPANGPVEIELTAGTLYRKLTLTASGGVTGPATRLEVPDPPLMAHLGQESAVRFRALAVRQPLANASVRITIDQGDLQVAGAAAEREYTLTTNTNGEGAFRFTPQSYTEVRLRASVAGTQLNAQVALPVGIASQ